MGWRDRAEKYFPEAATDNTPPAKLPSLPTSPKGNELGKPDKLGRPRFKGNREPDKLGNLAGHTVSGQDQGHEPEYGHHVSAWRDYLERAAILEFEGGMKRAKANRVALYIVRNEHRTKRPGQTGET